MGGVIVRVPFRQLQTITPTGATFTYADLDLNPFSYARLTTIAPVFQYFRFVELKVSGNVSVCGVTLFTGTAVSSAGGRVYLSYSREGINDTTAPTTAQNMAELDAFAHGTFNGQKLFLRIPRRELVMTPTKWFRCNSQNSPPYDLTTQGSVGYAIDCDANITGVNPLFEVLIEGVCEFQSMTTAGVGAPTRVKITVPTLIHDDDEKTPEEPVLVPAFQPP
jgi:hypothetical protein